MSLTVNYNEAGMPDCVPTYLFDQAERYKENPRDAALEWFNSAILGLSLHFGLPSLLGKGEEPQGVLAEELYRKLPEHFHCKNFDAVDAVELAIAAGARYISFPAVLPDGFCLYHTSTTDFCSVHSAAQRDLVGELASTCEFHGLGLFLEYPFGRNRQRHPQGVPQGVMPQAEYLDFVKEQLHELLTLYGPVAGISFTGRETLQGRQTPFDLADLFKLIHFLQPNALVSFREGVSGEEDFLTSADLEAGEGLLPTNTTRPLELLSCLTPGNDRSYHPEHAGKHLKPDQVWERLGKAHAANANLLLNTALMPDGSLDLEDIQTLLAVGERMEKEGRP